MNELPKRLTVIFEDKTITMNNETVNITQDIENTDNISAIQWFGKWGEIEYTDKTISNIHITEDTHGNIIKLFVNLFEETQAKEKEEALLAEKEQETYTRKRAGAFPTIGDQLDVLWKQMDKLPKKQLNKDTISMLKEIVDVKKKYPK